MSTTNKDFKVKNGLIVGGSATFDGTISILDPTESYHAATKDYVDSNAGGSSLTVSDTPPANPNVGDQWYNSGDGVTYVYYDSFWVESSSGGADAGAVDFTSIEVASIMGVY